MNGSPLFRWFSPRFALGAALSLALSGMLAAHGMQGKPKPKPTPPPATGAVLYKAQCAACHGTKGEGAKAYPKPLTGTLSPGELARFIAKSMPPGPKKCTTPDSQKIASFIHDAFYSPVAQERLQPPRVTLARLTVRQFRNAVTDLVGSFRPEPTAEDRQGLRAEYFKARRFSNNERVLERVDPQVAFDFGTQGPIPEKFDPHQFSIRWAGSVLAPDTGEYELIVHTDHAVRLFVNDTETPLIDAWVKSGKDTEFHGTISLLGGRVYPLRLEFSKSTQGVDDTKQKEGKPAPGAFVRLTWKRPNQAEEVIPQRCLSTKTNPPVFVVTTPFPPDDRSRGYERGNAISKAWEEAVTAAAFATARYVGEHLRELAPNRDPKALCQQFVERAFRRPLTTDETALYIDRQFQKAADPEQAVRRVVLLTLQSPHFLYQDPSQNDSWAVAARLAFTLWDSLPDPALRQAAASGALSQPETLQQQAERLAADPRAWFKLREFFLQWLRVDHYPDLAKDSKRFPTFDAAAASDLRTSLELFLESTARDDKADWRQLLLSDQVFLNGRLAKLYGADLPENAPFQAVSLDNGERTGVLTQPYLLASFAYLGTSSPIHRGVLLARNLLGRTLAPPPVAVAPLAADLHPNLTTRQRVVLQTKPAACMSCHGMINPLGFTLERFDAIGRRRTTEQNQPVDTTGTYLTRAGTVQTFTSSADLARFLADSPEAHTAFIERLFHQQVKQPIRAYGTAAEARLTRLFSQSGYRLRALQIGIAVEAAQPPR